MSVKDELEQIRQQSGGMLRAEDVVAFAEDETTALHKHFEWDDTEAARQYRLDQARSVIRIHVQITANDATPVRAYVSLVEDRRNPGGGYRLIDDVLADPVQRASMLATAFRDLDRFRAKYHRLSELSQVFTAMDQARESQAVAG